MMTMRVFLSYNASDSQIAEQLLPRLVAEKLEVSGYEEWEQGEEAA